MMTYCVNTPHGAIEVSMSEFFDLFEHRLSLKQVLLRRKLREAMTASNSS